VHLHVDVSRSAAATLPALLAACRAQGLTVASTHEAPRARGGRASFVVELADPLPGLPADATPSAASRDVYPLSVFDTGVDRCRIATIPPTAFVDLLGHPEAAPAALALEQTLRRVLDDAARGPATP
jgi:hypothetical protein